MLAPRTKTVSAARRPVRSDTPAATTHQLEFCLLLPWYAPYHAEHFATIGQPLPKDPNPPRKCDCRGAYAPRQSRRLATCIEHIDNISSRRV